MTDSLSLFGHSRKGWNFGPKLPKPHSTPSAHHGHSLLHNLLTDIRDTAVGLPMGLITTGKDLGLAATGNVHPLEQLGKNLAKSSAYTYSPLVHGNFGEFGHRVHNHPLAPILDAISIATLPVAGVGAGVKAGSSIARIGERVGAVSAERVNTIERAASHFRAQSRQIEAIPGKPTATKIYHANPVNRTLQRGMESVGRGLAQKKPGMFGYEGSIRDLGDTGMQQRWIEHDLSRREAATSAMFEKEMKAARVMFKNKMSGEDIANLLDPHIYQIAKSFAHEMHSHNFRGKSAKLHEDFAFLPKKSPNIPYPKDNSEAEMGKWFKRYGARLTDGRTSLKNAARSDTGAYLVVRKSTINRQLRRGAQGYSTIRKFYTSPTKVWKWMVLATAPRYFVNNVIGNSAMLLMAHNPIATSRGLYHAFRDLHGQRQALKSMSAVDQAVAKIGGIDWQSKLSATHQGLGYDLTRDLKMHERLQNPKVAKAVLAFEHGLYGITHHVSDTIPRRIAMHYLIMRDPEYQYFRRVAPKELNGKKLTGREAHAWAADKATNNPVVREKLDKEVSNIFGQYYHYTAGGRSVKSIIPFYGWNRAIMRHAWAMIAERPAEAAAFARIGPEGVKDTEAFLGGHVPSFLKGAIPLGKGQDGRKKILATTGLNPYSAASDTVQAAASLASGDPKLSESLAQQMNPLITTGIEHLTGTSLITGAKVKKRPGGVAGDIVARTAETTPYVRLIETAIQGRPHPHVDKRTGKTHGPLLFRGDMQQQVSGLLGYPEKEVATSKAHQLAKREEGIKSPPAQHYKKPNLSAFSKHIRSTTHTHRKRKTSVRHAPTHTFRLHKPKSILPKVAF